MWLNNNGVLYKNMAYHNSCFPCALHVVLANVHGIVQDDSIEALWDEKQMAAGRPSLTQGAPDEADIHRNMGVTPQLIGHGTVFTPTHFTNQADAISCMNTITQRFAANNRMGMVIGVNHATVILKLAANRYAYIHPSPRTDQYGTSVTEAAIIDIDITPLAQNNWIITVNGQNNPDFVTEGDFICLIG